MTGHKKKQQKRDLYIFFSSNQLNPQLYKVFFFIFILCWKKRRRWRAVKMDIAQSIRPFNKGHKQWRKKNALFIVTINFLKKRTCCDQKCDTLTVFPFLFWWSWLWPHSFLNTLEHKANNKHLYSLGCLLFFSMTFDWRITRLGIE